MRPVLLVDHRDSFTWNLWQAIEALGAPCEVQQAEGLDVPALVADPPRGLVLSPGPCSPREAGASPAIAAAVAAGALDVPLLGVCLGHQVVAFALGAAIVRASRPVHGRTWAVHHRGEGIFAGLPSPLVQMRYHSLVVDRATLPPSLEVVAETSDGEIMALQHRSRPIVSVQFHPESFLSERGTDLLGAWLAGLP